MNRMTAAQAAQQRNRDGGGRYATKQVDEVVGVELDFVGDELTSSLDDPYADELSGMSDEAFLDHTAECFKDWPRGSDRAPRVWLEEARARRQTLIPGLDGNDSTADTIDWYLRRSVREFGTHAREEDSDPFPTRAEALGAWDEVVSFGLDNKVGDAAMSSPTAVSLATNDPGAVSALANFYSRAGARRSRGYPGPDGQPLDVKELLHRAVQSEDPRIRATAATAFDRNDEAARFLAHDPDPDVRAAVASRPLNTTGFEVDNRPLIGDGYSARPHRGAFQNQERNRQALEYAREVEDALVRDPSAKVRLALAQSDRWVSGDTGDALLADPDPTVRKAALTSVLNTRGETNYRFSDSVSALIRDEDRDVREAASYSLHLLSRGRDRERARKALAQDSDPKIRTRFSRRSPDDSGLPVRGRRRSS